MEPGIPGFSYIDVIDYTIKSPLDIGTTFYNF